MSDPQVIDAVTDPHRVKSGDTLVVIAQRSGKTVAELQRLNSIANPNHLEIGQVVCLSERSAFGVTVSFLDALRQPIENLVYRLRFDGKTVQGSTASTGTTPRHVTANARSEVEVWALNTEQQWQQLARTVSGCGHKLITLVSGAIAVKGETQVHPAGVPLTPTAPPRQKPVSHGAQVPLPKPATGTPSKNNPRVKTKKTKAPQGQPIIEISVDIPKGLLDLFAQYKGGDIAAADWTQSADGLQCDEAVLKAIAEVESGGRNAFWRLKTGDGAHIPAILFERHYFSRLTNKKYDETHPDISWPSGYRKHALLGHKDKHMKDGVVEETDTYSGYAVSYLRLIKAYELNADAALKSCSWGKFQVMGDNYKVCGATDVQTFVNEMCTSELAQIGLLSGFIQNKPRAWKNPKNKKLGKEISLWDAVKNKDWKAIAFNYNGPGYATFSYDTKLEAAYEKHKVKT